MRTIYFTRKNPSSHYAIVTAVKPLGFDGAFPSYPDGTDIVEVEIGAVESVIGRALPFGDIVEGECPDEQFEEMFNN